MRGPSIAQAPGAVLVAVEDADLAIDGTGGAAVAVGVEGYGLDEVLVAVLEVQVEGGFLFVGGGRNGGGHCRSDRWRGVTGRMREAMAGRVDSGGGGGGGE